jgi:hypothetical protein
MFAAVYTYGHLLMAAFSLSMALAFFISATRVPNARSDGWWALVFVLTASGGLLEMVMSVAPSLIAARAYVALVVALFVVVTWAAYRVYGLEMLLPARRSWHRRLLVAYTLGAVILETLLWSGALDGGHTRALSLWGARSMTIAIGGAVFAIFQTVTILSLPLLVPILFGRGERQSERRAVGVPMVLAPLVTVHELLVFKGALHSLPFGGYFTALAGINGAFLLVERFRALSRTEVVGQYTVERRLGGGGMADVYLARRVTGGALTGVVQRVALKRLRPELADDPAFAQMFIDEARLIARLSHPNIVGLHDVGRERGELYLAMELVEGAALSRVAQRLRSRNRRFSTEVVIEVGLQLLDALAYAHALKDESGRPLELVHRDVSPQNVLLTVDAHIKLADFGIARSADRVSQTATGVIKGKLAYMAPEQLRGEAYDQRVDLYAVGLVMAEMLSGKRPFEGESDGQVLQKILQRELQHAHLLEGAPERLAQLLTSMLEADPERRPPSAAAVHRALLPLRAEARARRELVDLVALTIADDQGRDAADGAATRVNRTTG